MKNGSGDDGIVAAKVSALWLRRWGCFAQLQCGGESGEGRVDF